MATKKQINARAERLQQAIDAAVERAGEPIMTVEVITSTSDAFVTDKHEDGAWFMQHETFNVVRMLKSHRVGRNPSDKFFELKLVPQIKSLVIPCAYSGVLLGTATRLSDLMGMERESKPEAFIPIDTQTVAVIYGGNQLRSIIKLINQIK